MTGRRDLSMYWCMNPECPDYGKKGLDNLFVKDRYGKQDRTLLKCKTCHHSFSETRGTMFFGLDTPQNEVLRTLALIPEKGAYEALRGPLAMIRTPYADGLPSP